MTKPNRPQRRVIELLVAAYGRECQLERDLRATLANGHSKAWKQHASQHLAETREHAAALSERIAALRGRQPNLIQVEGEGAATEPTAKANGRVSTEEALLAAAQAEHAQGTAKIAIYRALESFAHVTRDRPTAELASRLLAAETERARKLEVLIERLDAPAYEQRAKRREETFSSMLRSYTGAAA